MKSLVAILLAQAPDLLLSFEDQSQHEEGLINVHRCLHSLQVEKLLQSLRHQSIKLLDFMSMPIRVVNIHLSYIFLMLHMDVIIVLLDTLAAIRENLQ